MKALPLMGFEDEVEGLDSEKTTTAGVLIGIELLAVYPSSARTI